MASKAKSKLKSVAKSAPTGGAVAKPVEYLDEKEDQPIIVSKCDGFRVIELHGFQYIDCRDTKHGGMRNEITEWLCNEMDEDSVYSYTHRYPVTFLLEHYYILNNINHKDKRALLKILKAEQKKRSATYATRKKQGMVETGDIETEFPVGAEVVFQNGDDIIGGVVQAIKIQSSWFRGTYFEIRLQIIHAIKGEVAAGHYTVRFPTWHGLVELSTLPMRAPTVKDRKLLTERGKKFSKFMKPGTYVSYKGTLTQDSYWSSRTFRADGRVVVDPISFERTDPETWGDCIRACGIQLEERDSTTKLKSTVEIDEKDYWRCLPVLYGFSLTVKQWGRLELDGMSDIQWRDSAWETLVLDPDEKDLIYSLVKFHGGGFTDIIEGKGGGCIFLLHGKPGWGKTASAEAVAELLHKPLYSVSVGELGVNTDVLERKLREILDVATIWDAVILLDEADIFLEERDEHNIQRNAMVGVFLRLLEYHNGVLFLTTNRVKKIDPAFFSRISVALHYRSEGKALKVWTNLLIASGLDPNWATEMSTFDVNGRQIKNAIRMAQTLARAKNRKVQITDLKRSCDAAIRFESEMTTKARKAANGE